MTRLRLLLAVALSGVSVPVGAQTPLLPDTVLEPEGGLRVVAFRGPSTDLVALRLFVPLEGDSVAAVATVLRDLALARMTPVARQVGARVSATRSPQGLALTVEGAATDLEYLSSILGAGLAPVDVDGRAFRDALADLQEARAREAETPAGKLGALLRAAVGADEPGRDATPTPAQVQAAWRVSRMPSALTLVASTPMGPAAVLAATRTLATEAVSGDDTAGPAASSSPRRGRAPRPDVLRRWYGLAWKSGAVTGQAADPTSDATPDPRAEVAAILLDDRLRAAAQAGGYEAGVRLVDLRDGWMLTLSGAAYDEQARTMRADLGGMLRATRAAVDSAAVADAVSRVREGILYRARTPAGLVTEVGRTLASTGDPAGAARHLAALDALDAAAMAAFFDTLLAVRPATAEVRP